MDELLTFIVTSLVSKPDQVQVETRKDGSMLDLILTVDPSDMGLVIGKNGQTIRSIRKILTVRAIAENVKVNLQLTDPNQTSNPDSIKADLPQENTEEVVPPAEEETKE